MYLISQHSFQKRDSSFLIYSPVGATSITSNEIIEFIISLKDAPIRLNSDEIRSLVSKYCSNPDSAISFLTTIGILKKIRDDFCIGIYSECDEILRQIMAQVEVRDAVRYIKVNNENDFTKCNIVIAIQVSYDFDFANRIYQMSKNNTDCIILHCYFAMRHFLIDGFYSLTMDLPDHYSGLHNLAGLQRRRNHKPESWADFFFKDTSCLENVLIPTFEITDLERSAALFHALMRIRPLVSGTAPLFADDLSSIVELSLDTGQVSKYLGVHSNFSNSVRAI